MNSRKIIGLVVAAVALVALAHWSTRQNRAGRSDGVQRIGHPALPTLQDADAVNQIARISFSSPASTFDVARIDGTWQAPDQHGYPVDFKSVRAFALKLVDMKVLQVVMVSAASQRRLGLVRADDEAAPEAPTGTRVVLKDAEGKPLADLMLGSVFHGQEEEHSPMAGYGGMPQGRYVAVGDDILIVNEPFSDLPREAGDWLEDDVAHVPAAELVRIVLEQPDRDPLVLDRPDPDKSFVLSGLAANETMTTAKLGNVSSVLSYLRFSDVADPALSDDAMGLSKPAAVYTAETQTGVRYRLQVGSPVEGQGGRFARLSAQLMAEPKVVSDGESEDDESDSSDAAVEREKLAADIEAKQALWSAWTYVLPDHKVNHALVAREDLVRPKEAGAGKESPDQEDDKDSSDKEDGKDSKPGFFGRLFGRG